MKFVDYGFRFSLLFIEKELYGLKCRFGVVDAEEA